MENRNIAWSKIAVKQFQIAINYISNDSIQNAEKVQKEILENINKLRQNPEIYSLDKLKQNNDGTYRAFELHHYRIAYRFIKEGIQVLRIRHTSREPKPH